MIPALKNIGTKKHSKPAQSQTQTQSNNNNKSSSSPQLTIVHYGHLERANNIGQTMDGDIIVEIEFNKIVFVQSIRVCNVQEVAHSQLLPDFIGRSSPECFKLSLTARDCSKPNKPKLVTLTEKAIEFRLRSNGKKSKRKSVGSSLIATDHLYLTGQFSVVSVIVYGYICDELNSNNCESDALAQTAFSPSIYANSDALTSYLSDYFQRKSDCQYSSLFLNPSCLSSYDCLSILNDDDCNTNDCKMISELLKSHNASSVNDLILICCKQIETDNAIVLHLDLLYSVFSQKTSDESMESMINAFESCSGFKLICGVLCNKSSENAVILQKSCVLLLSLLICSDYGMKCFVGSSKKAGEKGECSAFSILVGKCVICKNAEVVWCISVVFSQITMYNRCRELHLHRRNRSRALRLMADIRSLLNKHLENARNSKMKNINRLLFRVSQSDPCSLSSPKADFADWHLRYFVRFSVVSILCDYCAEMGAKVVLLTLASTQMGCRIVSISRQSLFDLRYSNMGSDGLLTYHSIPEMHDLVCAKLISFGDCIGSIFRRLQILVLAKQTFAFSNLFAFHLLDLMGNASKACGNDIAFALHSLGTYSFDCVTAQLLQYLLAFPYFCTEMVFDSNLLCSDLIRLCSECDCASIAGMLQPAIKCRESGFESMMFVFCSLIGYESSSNSIEFLHFRGSDISVRALHSINSILLILSDSISSVSVLSLLCRVEVVDCCVFLMKWMIGSLGDRSGISNREFLFEMIGNALKLSYLFLLKCHSHNVFAYPYSLADIMLSVVSVCGDRFTRTNEMKTISDLYSFLFLDFEYCNSFLESLRSQPRLLGILVVVLDQSLQNASAIAPSQSALYKWNVQLLCDVMCSLLQTCSCLIAKRLASITRNLPVLSVAFSEMFASLLNSWISGNENNALLLRLSRVLSWSIEKNGIASDIMDCLISRIFARIFSMKKMELLIAMTSVLNACLASDLCSASNVSLVLSHLPSLIAYNWMCCACLYGRIVNNKHNICIEDRVHSLFFNSQFANLKNGNCLVMCLWCANQIAKCNAITPFVRKLWNDLYSKIETDKLHCEIKSEIDFLNFVFNSKSEIKSEMKSEIDQVNMFDLVCHGSEYDVFKLYGQCVPGMSDLYYSQMSAPRMSLSETNNKKSVCVRQRSNDRFRSGAYSGGRAPSIHVDDFKNDKDMITMDTPKQSVLVVPTPTIRPIIQPMHIANKVATNITPNIIQTINPILYLQHRQQQLYHQLLDKRRIF